MPDSPRVSIVVWRDAKKEPPQEQDGLYQTDTGFWHYHDGRWVGESSDGLFFPAKPRPSVWCDPIPPEGEDALSVSVLRRAVDALMYASGDEGYPMVVNPEACAEDAARLRRAIAEIEKGTA